MFRRRNKQGILYRIRSWAWPAGGWVRAGRYIGHRLARMPGSSYSIAAGFASGAAVSFTPLVGTHFLWASLLAWIVRGNIIVALVGTLVGNPWTFPFIWFWLYESGSWIVRTQDAGHDPNFYSIFSHLTNALLQFDLDMFVESAAPVILPMLASGIPTAFVVWFIFYFPLKKMIDSYQRHRLLRRQRRGERGDT